MEILQPYLNEVVQVLISIVLMVIVTMLVEVRKRVLSWLENRTTKEQRELLHKWAEEAFSFAETVFKDVGGPKKLDAAYGYLSSRLREKGIELTSTEIRGLIEKAVLEYNSRVKRGDTVRLDDGLSESERNLFK